MKTRILRFRAYKVTRKRTHVDCIATIQEKDGTINTSNIRTAKGWYYFLDVLTADLTAMYEEYGMTEVTIIVKTKK